MYRYKFIYFSLSQCCTGAVDNIYNNFDDFIICKSIKQMCICDWKGDGESGGNNLFIKYMTSNKWNECYD